GPTSTCRTRGLRGPGSPGRGALAPRGAPPAGPRDAVRSDADYLGGARVMKELQCGRKGWRWWWAGAMVLSLFLIGRAIELPAEDCQVAEEQGGMRFPVARLDAGTRCLIGDVVNRYTTSGLIGP